VPESPLHVSSNDSRGSSSQWGSILAFIVLANAITWLACLLLRSTFAAGHLWALYIRVRHGMVAYFDCISLITLF
jgi:hypothetical protein